jgi:hypothetical protein
VGGHSAGSPLIPLLRHSAMQFSDARMKTLDPGMQFFNAGVQVLARL